jgi:glycosyltransferase involved in cell wall biosynthesis
LRSKLLYLATEDWAFCQHFLVMARAARQAGLDVVVGTKIRNHEAQIAGEGLRVVPILTKRGSMGSLAALAAIKSIAEVIRSERPNIIHCIGLPMAVLGGLAARTMGAKRIILAPTGLGHLWISEQFHVRILRTLVRLFLGRLLRSSNVQYLFENKEDPAQFGIDHRDSRLTIVGGAGVDPEAFPVTPEPPSPPVKIAIVSRMLRAKGIAEAVEATKMALSRGANIELHLFGDPDPSNPSSFSPAELLEFSHLKGIHWHGRTEDTPKVWKEHHIAMLLSYREGLPKSLVEAAAAGRPIVTSDVVGCREVVRDGVEGFLVPTDNASRAADRLVQLADNPGLRQRMGMAANERFRREFTSEKVAETMTSLYLQLLRNNCQSQSRES